MKQPNKVVLLIARLYLTIDDYRKENLKLKADNKFLRERLQTKIAFEVRV